MVYEKVKGPNPNGYIYLFTEADGSQCWWIGPELNGQEVWYENTLVDGLHVPCVGWRCYLGVDDVQDSKLTLLVDAIKREPKTPPETQHAIVCFI